MKSRAHISAVATAVPDHILDQGEVIERSREIFATDVPRFDRFNDRYRNTAIETRHSCMPIDWYAKDHPFSERNDLYVENAVELLSRVSRDLVDQAASPRRT
ncbi:MAG: hypothetical protein ACPGQM_09175 [Alphaproteobacteria bacterium]